jgi:hypothetical protein
VATNPRQRIWQGRFETLIGLGAPALDLMLTAGDRVSRLVLADDRDYYPIRPAGEAFELDPARRAASPEKPAPID